MTSSTSVSPVRRSLVRDNSNVVLSIILLFTGKDIRTLHGLNWLNDEVINFYMQLICERSEKNDNWPKVYAFNTFFYPKVLNKKWKSQ